MNENPYQAPAHPTEFPPPPGVDLVALKGIAQAQRRVNLCLLWQLGVLVLVWTLPQEAVWKDALIGILFIMGSIGTVICNLQLAKRIKGTGTAVAVGILSLLPPLGLLLLLMVSSWATTILKAAGFKVGLLGGSPRQVQKAIDAAATP